MSGKGNHTNHTNRQGGRGKDILWESYIRNADRAKCSRCGTELAAKIERLRHHKNNCSVKRAAANAALAKVNQSISSPPESPPSELPITNPSIELPQTSAAGGAKKRKQMQTDVTSYLATTTDSHLQTLTHQWARFFYSARIPFSASENPEFVKAMDMTRPGIGKKLQFVLVL